MLRLAALDKCAASKVPPLNLERKKDLYVAQRTEDGQEVLLVVLVEVAAAAVVVVAAVAKQGHEPGSTKG